MSLLARLVLSASEVPLVKLATVDWPQRVRLNAARANAFFFVLFLFVFHGIWGTRFLVVAQELRNYAGDEACQGCHVEQVTGYLSTPHHLTSRAPTKESILDRSPTAKMFCEPPTRLCTSAWKASPMAFMRKLYGCLPRRIESTPRESISSSAGRVGQTYLCWRNDHLFQLSVSYWADLGTWVNSPGYRDGTANFDRPVVPRCLEMPHDLCRWCWAACIVESIQARKPAAGNIVRTLPRSGTSTRRDDERETDGAEHRQIGDNDAR